MEKMYKVYVNQKGDYVEKKTFNKRQLRHTPYHFLMKTPDWKC